MNDRKCPIDRGGSSRSLFAMWEMTKSAELLRSDLSSRHTTGTINTKERKCNDEDMGRLSVITCYYTIGNMLPSSGLSKCH